MDYAMRVEKALCDFMTETRCAASEVGCSIRLLPGGGIFHTFRLLTYEERSAQSMNSAAL